MKDGTDINAGRPTAHVRVTFIGTDRPALDVEAPEMLTGGVDTIALAMGIRSLIVGAESVPVNQNGTGAVYYPAGREPGYERFTWQRITDVVSLHPDDEAGQ